MNDQRKAATADVGDSSAASGSKQKKEDDGTPLDVYHADPMQVIKIHMVYRARDLQPGHVQRCFAPDMVHQIFDVNPIIYGYRNLSIDIYFLGNSANCFVDVKYTELVTQAKPDSAPPDDLFKNLTAWLPKDYCTNVINFLDVFANEDHSQRFGEVINLYSVFNESENTKYKYIVTQCSASEPGFIEFHARFQCLLVWYIDAASQIDIEDPNWMFFYIYERRRRPRSEHKGQYPVGFCTVYKFFHFPDKIRVRISQLFILPSCQKTGLGTVLLKSVYRAIQELPNVIDIVVEDPCPKFTKLRDLVDCQLVAQLDSFRYPSIMAGFTKKMFDEANGQFKLNKRQCHRIYEILRLMYIGTDPVELEAFYDAIKRRLDASYARDQKFVMKKRLRGRVMDDQIYQSSICSRKVEAANYIRELATMAAYVKLKMNM